MDKGRIDKLSASGAAGVTPSGTEAFTPKQERLQNWAGSLEYSTSSVHYPKSLGEVCEIVKALKKLRPLGSRHSFNTIVDSKENLLSLKEFNKIVSLDKGANTVTVEGGVKYGELCQYLHENGYALQNMASLPHISIAGSCLTATHGSGVKHGNLATAVAALEFINAAGDVVVLSRKDGDVFYGAVVSLGALGVVTKLTLDLLPAFNMKQVVYRNLPIKALEDNFHTIMSGGYSVSLFTDWRNKNINQVWIKSTIGEGSGLSGIPPEFYGAQLAKENMHPIEHQPAENCTEQMGVPGPWYERLPHFRMGFTPGTGKELQSEYFILAAQGYEAIMAIEKLHDKISPHLYVSEIRTIAADELWMSPCYKKDCVAIHTTWKQDWNTVKRLLPLIEKQLAPFEPLPHWAKLFTISPSVLQSRIAKLDDFKQLMKLHDPERKFRNEFLYHNLFS